MTNLRPASRFSRAALALTAAALAGGALPARAEPVAAGVPDLIGARGLALGAYRGVLTGNDGLYTNAASLGLQKRYELDGQWLLDRVDGETALQALAVSVVDSTGAVTGGIGYTRVASGPWIGNLVAIPVAFPVGEGLLLGATFKYSSLDGPGGNRMRALNADASAYFRANRLVGLGVAGYNLFDTGHKGVQPRAVGAGVSVGEPSRYTVALDWRGDFDRRNELTSLLAVGAEYLVADLVPLRASYVKDDTRDASFWSVGAGVVSSGGAAIDLSFRQRFESPSEYTVAVGLKLFVSTL